MSFGPSGRAASISTHHDSAHGVHWEGYLATCLRVLTQNEGVLWLIQHLFSGAAFNQCQENKWIFCIDITLPPLSFFPKKPNNSFQILLTFGTNRSENTHILIANSLVTHSISYLYGNSARCMSDFIISSFSVSSLQPYRAETAPAYLDKAIWMDGTSSSTQRGLSL